MTKARLCPGKCPPTICVGDSEHRTYQVYCEVCKLTIFGNSESDVRACWDHHLGGGMQ